MNSTQKQNSTNWFKKSLHHYVKQAFIPRKSNQYHPHLIRRHGLLGLFILVVGLQIVSFSTANAASDMESTEGILLNATNNEREKNHLKPLTVNDKLSYAATLKAQDMLTHQYWAHIAPDGSTPWKWFDQAGYKYSNAGENLAKNFRTPQAVMAAWMASPEHRANILNDHYSEIGFASLSGKLDGEPVTLTVALYGTPSTMLATTASKTEASTFAGNHMGTVQRIDIAGQSMSLESIMSVVLLLIGVFVALLTYAYQRKMPKRLHVSWYRHHGLLKAGGMLSFCFIIILLYSGGQI